jgi:rhodanese-related sulfurtransferase
MAPVARYVGILAAAVVAAVPGASARAGHDYEEPIAFVSPEQAKRLIDIGEDIIFIDLRSAEDFAKGRLPNAKSISIDTLGRRWKEIPMSGRVVLYCACPPGERDETYAFALLHQEKYRNISVLEAGFGEWAKRGFPVERDSR